MKTFGLNILKLSVRGLDLKIHCYRLMLSLTDGDKPHLLESNSGILLLPAGYTSKCQPMEVSLNKPFKAVSRRFWVKYVASVVEGFSDANSDTSFKLPVHDQHTIDWVKEGSDYLFRDQEIV